MMAAEVDVVEVGSTNSLVPNLTISVENEEDDSNALPEIEYEADKPSQQMEIPSEKNSESSADIKPCLNQFPRKKIYENTSMGGAAELGLSFEEAKSRRQERAKRFASPLVNTDESENTTSEELVQAAKFHLAQLEEFNKSLSDDDENHIRPEALHLIGVDALSTAEIFGYFGKTTPRFIEWVNDTSCNVVWSESFLAAMAMEKVAEPYEEAKGKKLKHDIHEKTTSSPSFDDDLDLMEETEEMEVEEEAPKKNIDKKQATNLDTSEGDGSNLPINPLRKCREAISKSNHKSVLQVRFALVTDKKELFAAKKSKYYMKHGNPHYGGAKGLLSSTYRKRYQMKKAMNELKSMNVPTSKQYSEEYYTKRTAEESTKNSSQREQKKTKIQKEDDHLLYSTAEDLNNSDKSSGEESDDSNKKYGSMIADRISRIEKSVRGGISITTTNKRIHSRLGKRRYGDGYSRESSHGNVLNRLSKDLRSRLGSKRNCVDDQPFFHREDFHDEKMSNSKQSEIHKRLGTDSNRNSSPMDSGRGIMKSAVQKPRREMKKYSPPPWSDESEEST
ncbi:uncharacterized protein LOC143462321 isoform X1 [Clavelina lepadiformis]|uniref:uncharacterized protein LOC143462321 isoform X1 n=1 Tax=Clavelina lepadiformis TaxID=159417 RepID=UPI00404256ED